ncbi:MAG TPA: AAA family ATPase [Chthoniobacterales bacterium]
MDRPPMPHHEEYERALISALVQWPEQWSESLHPGVFHDHACNVVFRNMLELRADGVPITNIAVAQRLRDIGQIDQLGGPGFIAGLLGCEVSPVNIPMYVAELSELADRRRIIAAADKASWMARDTSVPLSEIVSVASAIKSTPVEDSWKSALSRSVVTSSELMGLALKPREKLLGDWFCEGDMGFIFAPRGVGKTWMALGVARALSEGGRFGPWRSHKATSVLYVDGEMPPDLIRSRDVGLSQKDGNITFLNHEILFDRTGRVLNITNPEIQDGISALCTDREIKVVILDNLSTLASGMKENDAFAWEQISNWLLNFRRLGIAVIVVHHAGRNGEMRGTSKREDAAFWAIALDDAKVGSDDKTGAKFISRFTKPSRNTPEETPAYEWHVGPCGNAGKILVTYKPAQGSDVFRRLVEEGVTDCATIAEEMRISKGMVSRLAKRGIDEGWLIKSGREYAIRAE